MFQHTTTETSKGSSTSSLQKAVEEYFKEFKTLKNMLEVEDSEETLKYSY